MFGLSRDDVWMADIDVIGGVGAVRRRRRSALERRRVVEETLEAGASVARVALKYGVNANQVFQWRRLYRDGKLGAAPQSMMKLLPVMIADDEEPAKSEPAEVGPSRSGAIHIELPGEILISLEGSLDTGLVRAVLESLRA
jgi:transposase